jgi:hypothetical protein
MEIIAVYSKNHKNFTVIQLEQSSPCACGANKIVIAVIKQNFRGSSKACTAKNEENKISVAS